MSKIIYVAIEGAILLRADELVLRTFDYFKMIDFWRIVAIGALVLAILFAALGWPWAAALCGLIAGTYAGALGVVCLFNLVNVPLNRRLDDRMASSDRAEQRAFDLSQRHALSILNSSVQDLHELGRRLRRERE